jgi:TonB family protein
MLQLRAALALCALLLSSLLVRAQEPAKPAVTLQPPADAVYPSGRAMIEYSLEQPADRVDIDVLDSKGAVVAGWSGGAKYRQAADAADRLLLSEALTRPGHQTVTWDLHASGYFGAGAEGVPPKYSPGPLVPPGHYVVQITALGETTKQPLNIVPQLPLAAARQADLEAQFELAMQIRGSASAASAAIRRVRTLEDRVKTRLATATDPAMKEAGAALVRRLDEIAGTAGEPVSAVAGVVTLRDALSALRGEVEAGGRPSDARVERYRLLSTALQAQILSLNALTAGAFARFERGETGTPDLSAREYGVTTVKFDNKGVDFGPWLRTFMATLNRGWTVPKAAMLNRGHVAVTFVVHRSGAVTDIVVAAPSEVAIFDDSARKAVFAASLAQPLPDAFPSETCPFTITFYFNEKPPAAVPRAK